MTYKVCQVCLKSRENVLPLLGKDIQTYNRILKETSKESEIFMCIFCISLLRKLDKFLEQCRNAQNNMHEAFKQENLQVYNLNNITISKINTHYVGPEKDVKTDITLTDEVPFVFCDNSLDGDSENILEDEKFNTELNIKDDVKKNGIKIKKKKILKEGFTSRMVQETSEYIVIKLTKEQVLEEMKVRSKSEKYLRAPYKCESCVKGFNFEDVLQSHMDKHLQKQNKYRCEICSQYCPSVVSLRGHMKSHTNRYKCKICGYLRLSRQHVLEHHAIEHTHAAAYSCSRCNFTTDKRTVMQRHVRVHEGNAPHACHTCGKLYKTLESLRVHTMRHDNKKKFQCEQCKLSFIYPTQLNKHIQSVHIRRDYYCVECDVKFKSMDTLKLHFKRAKRHRDGSHSNKGDNDYRSTRTRSRRKENALNN